MEWCSIEKDERLDLYGGGEGRVSECFQFHTLLVLLHSVHYLLSRQILNKYMYLLG